MVALVNVLVPFLVGLCVLSTPLFITLGIIFFVIAADNAEPDKKRKWKRWGGWTMGAPFIAIVLMVTLWGLLQVATSMK